MIKILLFADTYKHYDSAIKEYEKRLGKDVEIIKLKPSKKKEVCAIINDETKLLKEKLIKLKGYKILLYSEGTMKTTENFAIFLEKNLQNFSDIIFIIGGSYGLNGKEIKEYIHYTLSFSLMTFPHIGAFLILLEQIYRIKMIKKGSHYHH